MTSLENSPKTAQSFQNYSVPSDLLTVRVPKTSILKKSKEAAPQNPSNFSLNPAENPKKPKLSFQSPIEKTYCVENWKEYNVDASKEDEEFCICLIF